MSNQTKQQINQLKKIFNKSKVQQIRIFINSKINNTVFINNIRFIVYFHDHVIIQLDKIYYNKIYKFYYKNIETRIDYPVSFIYYETIK